MIEAFTIVLDKILSLLDPEVWSVDYVKRKIIEKEFNKEV